MNVIHLLYIPRFSGAEALVVQLAELQKKSGHDVTVASLYPSEKDFEERINYLIGCGVNCAIPDRMFDKLEKILMLRSIVKGNEPYVIFAHSIIPSAYARIAGLKNVVTVLHDASQNDYASGIGRWSEYFLQYRSAGIVAVAEMAATNYKKKYKYPVTRVIANGVNLSQFKCDVDRVEGRRDFFRKIGLSPDIFLAVQIGRITRIKRQLLSIEATAELIRLHPNVHLALVGVKEDAELENEIYAKIKQLGVGKNVHLFGGRSDVVDFLQYSDLYLMPSEKEAHSVAMIEALASGIEIIASDIESFQHYRNYDGVSLIDPTDIVGFANSMSSVLKARRWDRDMRDYDILETSRKYIEIANKIIR